MLDSNSATLSAGFKWLVGLASLMIILGGLKIAEAVVVPMLLAIFIAIICAPPLAWMTSHRVPPWLAVMLLVLGLMVFSWVLMLFVGSAIDTFTLRLPIYQERLQDEVIKLLPNLERLGLPVTQEQLLNHFNPGSVMRLAGNALTNLGGLLTDLMLIIFVVIFLLMEATLLGDKLHKALPNAEHSMQQGGDFVRKVNKYLVIKTTVSVGTGFLVTLWLWILGVDFAPLWGLVAALMNFIPTVGSIIAAVPAVLLAIVQLGLPDAALVALGYIAVNLLMGNVLEPRYMGSGLGLSPLVVFLSLMVWGWMFGPAGMFLSIPLTMIAKIALEQSPSTRWVAIMLGN
ncbi:AI-2E family transporter [Marinobacterium marinum]|uniref:AI-2E family transporter n=1 Tax=Marinobacterium marinum TaxID=2756129 RepID=A0A7W1WWL8_9GAMM|nr:AI-2E family transporter [Marinobacterium marinum]MBA4501541.1 AI-2E family transporter [Marinobacterium marinum]